MSYIQKNSITKQMVLLSDVGQKFSNRPLAAYLKELIGDEYLTDATKLEKLLAFVDSKEVAAKLEEIKHEK